MCETLTRELPYLQQIPDRPWYLWIQPFGTRPIQSQPSRRRYVVWFVQESWWWPRGASSPASECWCRAIISRRGPGKHAVEKPSGSRYMQSLNNHRVSYCTRFLCQMIDIFRNPHVWSTELYWIFYYRKPSLEVATTTLRCSTSRRRALPPSTPSFPFPSFPNAAK